MNPTLPFDFDAQFARVDAGMPVHSAAVIRLEKALGVTLPEDFSRICEFYEDSGIASFGPASFGSEPQGHTIERLTQSLRRETGLPAHYVVLGATPQFVLLLGCENAPRGCGTVHLVSRKSLTAFNTDVLPAHSRSWPTFVEYFSDVLTSGDGAL